MTDPAVRTTDRGVPFLRTPDERFAGLPDFPWEPQYVTVDGFRMAYLDEGPTDDPRSTFLLLHGEPTWSYLYRRMIPTLIEAGHRIIAPDLIGFGRSDKPTERSTYTYAGHVAWVVEFLDRIDVAGPFDAFVQDWGGLIGLRLAAEHPDRFGRLVIANTALPVGEPLGDGFDWWLEFSQTADPFDVGTLIGTGGTAGELSEAEMDAYRAPFPDESYQAGARQFPTLVPITPEHGGVAENRTAREVLATWTAPTLTVWGTADPVLGHLAGDFLDLIPGTAGQPHRTFEASHFIQDDVGDQLAAHIVDWLASLD